MAIHPVVFYSPDRRIRITADPGGKRFTVERDLVFLARADSLAELGVILAKENLAVEDLIQD